MRTLHFIVALVLLVAMPMHAAFDAKDPNNAVLSGFVKDGTTGEVFMGAVVSAPSLQLGTITNAYGFFSLVLPKGTHNLQVSYLGYETLERSIKVSDNIDGMEIELMPSSEVLSELVITSKRGNENVTRTQMSAITMNTESMKKIPAFMGEIDVLKTVQMMPGVQHVAEGFSGFSVRGGAADQNLILLDEAPVYNASHLLGFFSVFNGDAIRGMELYKGDIPAQYGGRLSSLLDIRMREGNMKKFQATGGLGTIASRLTLEGPIVKDKASFMVSGRRTYADMFLAFSNDSMLNNNKLYFYDLNMKANYIINPKNRVYLSAYFGRDVFAFQDMMSMQWGNATQTIRWNRVVSDKLFANTSLIHSDYSYSLTFNQGMSDFLWNFGIKDLGLKLDLDYRPNQSMNMRFGGEYFYHIFRPGSVSNTTDKELLFELDNQQTMEYAAYVSNDHKLTDRFSVQYGLRFSAYQNLGAATVYEYNDRYELVDSALYKQGEIYNTEMGLEPRLSAVYQLTNASSLKSSYARTRQHVQIASNASAGLPTDMWFPVSPNVAPQVSDQVALGYFRNFLDNEVESSFEVYYKVMDNQIDFRDNAELMFNEYMEGELRIGEAKSYGVELMLAKETGRLSGRASYTLSKALRRIEEINNYEWYNANYDKPHSFNIMLSYQLWPRVNIGAAWIYTTGAPTTLPTSKWEYYGVIMPGYSERNGYRLPDYHRLDVSTTIRLSKERRKTLHELNISVFNAYNRKNPFTIYFEPESPGSSNMQAYQLSMFGIVPSITWNFRF